MATQIPLAHGTVVGVIQTAIQATLAVCVATGGCDGLEDQFEAQGTLVVVQVNKGGVDVALR